VWVPEYKFDSHIINPYTGKLGRHRFDWALADLCVAVEIDGGVWKPRGGRHGTDKDREKLNIAASLGWLVFRFSEAMLEANPNDSVQLVWNAVRDRHYG